MGTGHPGVVEWVAPSSTQGPRHRPSGQGVFITQFIISSSCRGPGTGASGGGFGPSSTQKELCPNSFHFFKPGASSPAESEAKLGDRIKIK